MDIQTRKIEFVQEFLKLQSEELISRFEKLLKTNQNIVKPMDIEELNSRIDKSLLDSENDKITENSDLISEIQQWN